MMKVVPSGDPALDVRNLLRSVNQSEAIEAVTLVQLPVAVVAGAAVAHVGGMAIDRSVFRQRLPDARWVVYAAGLAASGDANPLTIALSYVSDALVHTTLGSTTVTSVANVKTALGPFDVFGTAGVPQGETIPLLELDVTKPLGANGNVVRWTLWLRFLTTAQ